LNTLKGYVGGLVHFDGSVSHIALLGFYNPIMECQLHCLAAFVSLETEAQPNGKRSSFFQ